MLNIVDSFNVGGAERYLSRVAPLLRQHHDVELEICLLTGVGPLLEQVRARGVPVFVAAPQRRRSGPKLYEALDAALSTVAAIAGLIRRRRYDIVHSYLFSADVLGTLAARLTGSPRVIISRRALHPLRRPQGPAYGALETLTNLLADELIANSWAVLRDVERTEKCLPGIRTVIYNGVDPSDFPLAQPQATGVLRLVTVGRLAEPKGQEFAIGALRLILDAGVDAELTLVGSGPNEQSLRQTAAAHGVDEKVRFPGLARDPRLFLRDADVFLLPSTQEGFSNALLEAMACGLPVVATDVGGNAEALLHEAGGLIVAPQDPCALAEAVLRLASQRQRLHEMGIANRERVETHFSLRASVDRLAHWYLSGPT